jgi:hypothetical protein
MSFQIPTRLSLLATDHDETVNRAWMVSSACRSRGCRSASRDRWWARMPPGPRSACSAPGSGGARRACRAGRAHGVRDQCRRRSGGSELRPADAGPQLAARRQVRPRRTGRRGGRPRRPTAAAVLARGRPCIEYEKPGSNTHREALPGTELSPVADHWPTMRARHLAHAVRA